MSDIVVEEPTEVRQKPSPLIDLVSWYFIGIGLLGLIVVAASLATGTASEIVRHPPTLAAVLIARIGMILAGLQLRKRKRAAGIAAVVVFALPFLGNVMTGTTPSVIALFSALLGIGLIAAVWKDLKSD